MCSSTSSTQNVRLDTPLLDISPPSIYWLSKLRGVRVLWLEGGEVIVTLLLLFLRACFLRARPVKKKVGLAKFRRTNIGPTQIMDRDNGSVGRGEEC